MSVEELSDNAKRIFKNLYCLQNESIDNAFKRVADEFGEEEYDKNVAYELLKGNVWRPNTPVWLNAGGKHKIYSACFVVGLDDSMNGIYDIANVARKIFQFGAGIGIPIGNLRERNSNIFEGDRDSVPEGKSSGPVTFMKLYDAVGDTTKSGGRVRRAAILCTMPVWHPDIMEFIECKNTDGNLSNMNISIAFTDKYMNALEDGIPFNLHSPSDGKDIGTMDAQELWDKLAYMAWKTGDPGVLFIDTINKHNVLKKRFLIETPNPCVTGDTLVSTIEGNVRIDEMTGSEKILTYNIEDGIIEIEDITFVGKTKIDVDIISIETEDGEILKLTPDHKIFTENRGYVMASDLNEKDILLIVE